MDGRDGALTPILGREIEPPAHLRRRVVRTLRRRRLLATGGGGRWRGMAAAAAAVLLMAGGFLAGARSAAAPAAPDGPRFVLLLFEDEGFTTGAPTADLVAEYGRWAANARSSGVTIDGEKLGEDGWVLDSEATQPDRREPDHPGLGRMTGYFVLSATDEAEALAIARTCPHLRYGGRVVLRGIVPT